MDALISQKPEDMANWPENAPWSVGAAASTDAISIIIEITDAVRVEDGKLIVPQWVQFRIAGLLQNIRTTGYNCELEG